MQNSYTNVQWKNHRKKYQLYNFINFGSFFEKDKALEIDQLDTFVMLVFELQLKRILHGQ